MFNNYELINMCIMLIGVYSLIIIAISIFRMSIVFRNNKEQKKIEFTQKVIEERKDDLEKCKSLLLESIYSEGREKINYIFELLNHYNFFIEGIKIGIFNDDLIRIRYKNDIKEVLGMLRSIDLWDEFYSERYDYLLYSIEFKLRAWDTPNNISKKRPGARW